MKTYAATSVLDAVLVKGPAQYRPAQIQLTASKITGTSVTHKLPGGRNSPFEAGHAR
jgi:hypothetical protein